MKICIITVNYNNSQLTCELCANISSFLLESEYQLYIVDNASSIDDKVILSSITSGKTIYNEENIGYFQGVNSVLKTIDTSAFDYIIICNNDILFGADFFKQLSISDYPKDAYVISPRIFDVEGIDQNPMLSHKISRLKIFFYDIYYKNYTLGQLIYKIWRRTKKNIIHPLPAHEDKYIFMGYGAIFVLTKMFLKENKILDTPPFIMGEEAFLANQVYKTGGKVFYDHKLVVHHKDHSSCSKIPTKKMYFITKESYSHYRNILLALPDVE